MLNSGCKSINFFIFNSFRLPKLDNFKVLSINSSSENENSFLTVPIFFESSFINLLLDQHSPNSFIIFGP